MKKLERDVSLELLELALRSSGTLTSKDRLVNILPSRNKNFDYTIQFNRDEI